jgi:hypothetical protein
MTGLLGLGPVAPATDRGVSLWGSIGASAATGEGDVAVGIFQTVRTDRSAAQHPARGLHEVYGLAIRHGSPCELRLGDCPGLRLWGGWWEFRWRRFLLGQGAQEAFE